MNVMDGMVCMGWMDECIEWIGSEGMDWLDG